MRDDQEGRKKVVSPKSSVATVCARTTFDTKLNIIKLQAMQQYLDSYLHPHAQHSRERGHGLTNLSIDRVINDIAPSTLVLVAALHCCLSRNSKLHQLTCRGYGRG